MKKSFVSVEGNRYKMLAIAVARNSGLTLADALGLTLVEAWLTLGAKIHVDG